MIAVVLTELDEKIRVITAYDLDAGQRRDYLQCRAQGSDGKKSESETARVRN
jgi:hypothetical protein